MMTRFLSTTTFLALLLAGAPGSAAPQEERPSPAPERERAVTVDRAPSHEAPARYEAPVPRAESRGSSNSSGSTGVANTGGPGTTSRAEAWADRAPGFNRGLAWADQAHRAVPRGGGSSSSSGGSRVSSGSPRGSAPSSSGSSVRSGPSSGRGGGYGGTYDRADGRRSSGGSAGAYARSRDGRAVTGTAVPRSYHGGGYYPPYYPGWGNGYWDWGYWYPGWGYYGWWPYWGFGWGFDYGYYGSYGPYYADDYSDELGSVRLKVRPRDAAVHVDGYYVGIVDEFDGAFQRLKVEVGPHVITVKKPGFVPLEFKVRVVYDHTLTLDGELMPEGQGPTAY